MSGPASQFMVHPGSRATEGGALPEPWAQELWFSIARRPWNSLVLVPAERGTSAADLARALAAVGDRLGGMPVTAIVAGAIDFDAARSLSEFHLLVADHEPKEGAGEDDRIVAVADAATLAPARDVASMAPFRRVIIAIEPVVEQPLGVAVAQAADAVLLCVEAGRTRLASARRTIELIGADLILGSFLVRGA